MVNDTNNMISRNKIFTIVVMRFATCLLPLLITQRWDWMEGWLFATSSLLCIFLSHFVAVKRFPDVLEERMKFIKHEDTKKYDKLLAPAMAVGVPLITIAAGVDSNHSWTKTSHNSFWTKLLLFTCIAMGYSIVSYAFIENRFFSSVMRIQSDRGHKVVATGPYRVIRHPGYAGLLLVYAALPPFLDSYVAFIPAIFNVLVTIVRAQLEDSALQKELEGYKEYAARVRYRFVPGLW